MSAPLCATCADTGLENHADVAAYWSAVDAAIDGFREEGRRGRSFGPGPQEIPCDDCPVCPECGYRLAEHDPEILATAMREAGSRHWSVPDCAPVRNERGRLVPSRRAA